MLFTNEKTGLAILYIISIYALKGNEDFTVIFLSVQLDKTKIDKIRPASSTFTCFLDEYWMRRLGAVSCLHRSEKVKQFLKNKRHV